MKKIENRSQSRLYSQESAKSISITTNPILCSESTTEVKFWLSPQVQVLGTNDIFQAVCIIKKTERTLRNSIVLPDNSLSLFK